jgi:hypothetical protein
LSPKQCKATEPLDISCDKVCDKQEFVTVPLAQKVTIFGYPPHQKPVLTRYESEKRHDAPHPKVTIFAGIRRKKTYLTHHIKSLFPTNALALRAVPKIAFQSLAITCNLMLHTRPTQKPGENQMESVGEKMKDQDLYRALKDIMEELEDGPGAIALSDQGDYDKHEADYWCTEVARKIKEAIEKHSGKNIHLIHS